MAEEGHEVLLHVYDLSQGLARQLSRSFLGKAIEGIWHTGVVVYGNEYYFGGGIQHSPAAATPYGTPLRVVKLGTTHIPKEVFEEYLSDISERYTAETYSLLFHNCNTFSNEVAQFLVGEKIPKYILELPNEVMDSPMGGMILPMIEQLDATMRVGAVPQAPLFKPASAKAAASQPTTATSASTASSASERPANNLSDDTGKSDNRPTEVTDMNLEKPKDLGGEVPPAVAPRGAPETAKSDPLGDARSILQEEICSEFAAIMASGTLRASEAAALATRRVMEKHGRLGAAASQS